MADIQDFVEAYLEDPTPANREAVILESMALVRSIIRKVPFPKNHPLVSWEDLESTAIVGLIKALDNYDPSQARFSTYAYTRVQGTLIDYLRDIDVLSRGKRKKVAEVRKAIETLQQLLNREPTDEDVADYLDISVEDYHDILVEAQRRNALSFFESVDGEKRRNLLDVIPDEGATEGLEQFERDSTLEYLKELVAALPERERTIVALYYTEDLTLREIGEVMDLTEARICQILGKVYLSLRARLIRAHPKAS